MIHGCDLVELGEAAQRARSDCWTLNVRLPVNSHSLRIRTSPGSTFTKPWATRVRLIWWLRAILAWMENSVKKLAMNWSAVVDDPTMMGGYGAYPVDDEGVNTREKVLIKNGVLTEYLNHRETAHHFDVDPNGGARAQDGLHHPLVRMSNTMIQAAPTLTLTN